MLKRIDLLSDTTIDNSDTDETIVLPRINGKTRRSKPFSLTDRDTDETVSMDALLLTQYHCSLKAEQATVPIVRFHLSAMPAEETVPIRQIRNTPRKKKRNVRRTVLVTGSELAYLAIALQLAYTSYQFFAAWPVYRVVAFVVIAIVWANFASQAARKKSIEMSTQALHIVSGSKKRKVSSLEENTALTLDTTTFLRAIRREYES